MKIRRHILLTAFLGLGVTLTIGHGPVFALSIFQYDFSGTVTSALIHEVDDPLPDLQVGDTFIGNLTIDFDQTLEDQFPSNENFAVYNTLGSYSVIFDNLTINPYYIYGYLPAEININLESGESHLTFFDFTPIPIGYSSDDLYFKFTDTTGTVFNNDALPYGIDIGAFDQMILWFDIYGVSGINNSLSAGLIEGRIDSIALAAVPEPGTGLLLLSGLGLLAYPRKSKILVNILKIRISS